MYTYLHTLSLHTALPSAAGETGVAQILQFEDGQVGASFRVLVEMRLGDFADDHVVVAQVHNLNHLALDRRDRAGDDRGAVVARAEGLAGNLAVFDFGRLEEGESGDLLPLAEQDRKSTRLNSSQ